MTMTFPQAVLTIAMVVLGTVITRFLPFLLFPASRPVPAYVKYLGEVLPTAVTGLLVVYCLRSISLFSAPFGLPELISIGVILLLHLWKRNTLLSLLGGTVCYMLLVQLVFAG